jgi:DNA-binding FadR family transcriptional regulator
MAIDVGRLSSGQVRVPKTAELVASHLRRQIIRGDLSEGDALPPEAELMEQFGVSRPTMREAFRVLESESLITIRRGSRGGARVNLPDIRVAAGYAGLLLQVSGTTLDDVFAARMALEPVAARMAAERGLSSVAEALEIAIQAEEAAMREPLRFAVAAAKFHKTLMAQSGNTTMVLLEGMLGEIVEMSTSHVVNASQVDSDDSAEAFVLAVKAHRRLVSLIAAGDGPRAEEFWRRHMEVVRERYRRTYGTATVVELLQ